ncbi:MAG: hormogonium polysaccharide biosynthesis protein HpsL [Xenococcaceae cyanobacterium]
MPQSKSKSKKSKKSKKQTETPPLSLKERLAQKRKAREARKKMISFIIACVFLGGLLGLLLGVAVSPKIGLGAALGVSSLLFSYQYPRQALWVFLIYMPFSGTVTYWIGGGNALFQLGKDVFYIPALLALVLEFKRKRLTILIPKKLVPTLGILLVFCIMTLFFVNGIQQLLPNCSDLTEKFIPNATGGPPIRVPCKEGMPFLQGILGLKVLIGYIPLIFCAYYLIEDKKQLLFLGRLLVVLAIICCALGLVQYWMLKSGRCVGTRGMSGNDLFRASLEAKCLVGGSLLYSPSQGQIRLPGTFVSPWHWAWFLIANSAITFTTAFSDTSFFWRMTGLTGMALVFVNAVICGQRIALALVPVVIAILLVLTGQIANLKRFIPIGVVLALVLGVAAANNPAIVQERIDSFVGRWNSSPPHLFIKKQYNWAISKQKGVLGRGLGKATNSARSFGSTALVETFHSKLLYEMGYLGTLAFMVFITHLTILAFKDYRSVRDKSLRSFASSFWVFILIISYFPYWYPLDTDPVAVYYWFLAGVIFKLPQIDKQEREKLKTVQKNESRRRKKGRIKTSRRRSIAT